MAAFCKVVCVQARFQLRQSFSTRDRVNASNSASAGNTA
jgi:hypothetical protein